MDMVLNTYMERVREGQKGFGEGMRGGNNFFGGNEGGKCPELLEGTREIYKGLWKEGISGEMEGIEDGVE